MTDQKGQGMKAGMHVQPGVFTVAVIPQTLPNGTKQVVFHVEHATGNTTLPMPTEYAANLGRELIQAASGIQLARPGDVPG